MILRYQRWAGCAVVSHELVLKTYFIILLCRPMTQKHSVLNWCHIKCYLQNVPTVVSKTLFIYFITCIWMNWKGSTVLSANRLIISPMRHIRCRLLLKLWACLTFFLAPSSWNWQIDIHVSVSYSWMRLLWCHNSLHHLELDCRNTTVVFS